MDAATLEKYRALPSNLQKEVVDFIEFLENKYHQQTVQLESLAQRRASLYGNAKGLITILPEFDSLPEGFDEYS